MYTVKLKGKIA